MIIFEGHSTSTASKSFEFVHSFLSGNLYRKDCRIEAFHREVPQELLGTFSANDVDRREIKRNKPNTYISQSNISCRNGSK